MTEPSVRSRPVVVRRAPPTGTGHPRVTRASLRAALDLGRAAWDALLPRAAAPFTSWAWHRAWADTALAEDVEATEALLLQGPGGDLQAVLPLLTRRVRFRRVPVQALTWAIGDDGCPDHLDLLACPGADFGALVAALETVPWRLAILDNVAAEASNVDALCAAFAARGHLVRRRRLWPCPYLALPADWEAYLATLSPTRRQTVRRKERNLSRGHAVTLTDYAADQLDEGWKHLLRLHAQRWNGAGAFRNPRLERLQRQFAQAMAQQARLWLTTLDVDGEPAAAWYGFASDDTVYFYQGGRAARWERESVGLVLMARMIRRAIERGYQWFDFLRGDDAYKRQWTNTERFTQELVIFRAGWRGRLASMLDWAAEWRRRLAPGRRGVGAESPGPGDD